MGQASAQSESLYCSGAWRGSLPCREHWRMLETQKNPRHAPCPPNLNRTAVGLSRPSAASFPRHKTWMAGTSPAMTTCHCGGADGHNGQVDGGLNRWL